MILEIIIDSLCWLVGWRNAAFGGGGDGVAVSMLFVFSAFMDFVTLATLASAVYAWWCFLNDNAGQAYQHVVQIEGKIAEMDRRAASNLTSLAFYRKNGENIDLNRKMLHNELAQAKVAYERLLDGQAATAEKKTKKKQ